MTDTVTIKDRDGRVLHVKQLSMMDEMDLVEAAGAAGENRRWMMMATICATVRQIGDVPCPFPRTKDAVRQHCQLVDNAGLEAAMEWLTPLVPAAAEAATENVDAAKN